MATSRAWASRGCMCGQQPVSRVSEDQEPLSPNHPAIHQQQQQHEEPLLPVCMLCAH